MELISIVMKCKKHPKYQAIRKPRVKCKQCDKIYEAKHAAPIKKQPKEKAKPKIKSIKRTPVNYKHMTMTDFIAQGGVTKELDRLGKDGWHFIFEYNETLYLQQLPENYKQ